MLEVIERTTFAPVPHHTQSGPFQSPAHLPLCGCIRSCSFSPQFKNRDGSTLSRHAVSVVVIVSKGLQATTLHINVSFGICLVISPTHSRTSNTTQLQPTHSLSNASDPSCPSITTTSITTPTSSAAVHVVAEVTRVCHFVSPRYHYTLILIPALYRLERRHDFQPHSRRLHLRGSRPE